MHCIPDPTEEKSRRHAHLVSLLLPVLIASASFAFYASGLYAGEGGGSDENCSDAEDNDSDTYVDWEDVDCLLTPGAPDLQSAHDYGPSDSDDITRESSPYFDVSCSSDYQVYLYTEGGGLLGGGESCAGGTVSVTTDSALDDGVHSIVARQSGAAENPADESSDSAALSLTIDTGVPVVSSLTPNSSSAINNVTSASDISWSMSENVTSGEIVITRTGGAADGVVHTCLPKGVALESGAHALDLSDTVDGCNADASSLVDGAIYTFTFDFMDLAGNNAAQVVRTNVTFDTTAPTTSGAPDMTPGTDLGVSSTDNLTSDATPTFAGTCTNGNTAQLYDDGVASGSSGACSGGAFSLTTGTLASGVNSITFKETDPAGNVSSASSALSVTIDTTDPIVSLDAPEDEAEVSGATVALDATASDTNLGGVRFYVDDVAEGAEDTSNPYGITWDSTGVADGSHEILAVARDDAGNYATSTLVTVTVSNSAPEPEPEPESEEVVAAVATGGSSGSSARSSSGREARQRALGLTGVGSQSGSGQSASGGSSSPGSTSFARNLDVGSSGSDVRELQRFLNRAGFTVAADGAGSPGNETDTFGGLTRDALARWQAANGISPAVGYFGPLTRAAIAEDSPAPFSRNLELHDTGDDVRALQELLAARAAGSASAALRQSGLTGYFGSLTYAALVELQRVLGIEPPSGFFGPLTRAALGL